MLALRSTLFRKPNCYWLQFRRLSGRYTSIHTRINSPYKQSDRSVSVENECRDCLVTTLLLTLSFATFIVLIVSSQLSSSSFSKESWNARPHTKEQILEDRVRNKLVKTSNVRESRGKKIYVQGSAFVPMSSWRSAMWGNVRG
jgi:hypothetical protein